MNPILVASAAGAASSLTQKYLDNKAREREAQLAENKMYIEHGVNPMLIEQKRKNLMLYLGLAAIGSFLAYKLYKAWQSGADERQKNTVLKNMTEPDESSPTTISNTQAVDFANKLLAAMDGMGTDDNQIEDILINKGLTDNDIRLIIKAFGVQQYGTFGKPYWGTGDPLDLSGWLRKEVSGKLLSKLQTRFSKVGFTI